ncbi:MAG: hypothetical protein NTY09_12000 [bacterium]|nr:hypothetical protein [bacterium]
MKKLFSCTFLILLMVLTLILYGCDNERSNNRDGQSQIQESAAVAEQGTNIGGNSEIDRPASDVVSESQSRSDYDPEAVIIGVLESLGYDRSYILFTNKELVPGEMVDMWQIVYEDGFGTLGAAYIADGADKPARIKFIKPTGDLSPELVQPGEDLPERIAGGLGLEEEGYVRASWNTMPDYAEFRKYASSGEYEVSTHQVRMFFDHQTGGLLAINFAGTDLDPNFQVVIDMDTAIETAVSSMGNSGLSVSHSELVQIVEPLLNNGDPFICWDITFENNSGQLVNSVDGTIVRFMQGRM